jgi:hypothetical protein
MRHCTEPRARKDRTRHWRGNLIRASPSFGHTPRPQYTDTGRPLGGPDLVAALEKALKRHRNPGKEAVRRSKTATRASKPSASARHEPLKRSGQRPVCPPVPQLNPCLRQNSTRGNPLASNPATNCSTSARLRRRRTSATCACSSILPLHHRSRRVERWVALTLTLDSHALETYKRTKG